MRLLVLILRHFGKWLLLFVHLDDIPFSLPIFHNHLQITLDFFLISFHYLTIFLKSLLVYLFDSYHLHGGLVFLVLDVFFLFLCLDSLSDLFLSFCNVDRICLIVLILHILLCTILDHSNSLNHIQLCVWHLFYLFLHF